MSIKSRCEQFLAVIQQDLESGKINQEQAVALRNVTAETMKYWTEIAPEQYAQELECIHAFKQQDSATGVVNNKTMRSQGFSVIPTSFVCFGAVALAIFCISSTILFAGFCYKSFPINPVYLFIFAVGALGLLITDIAAIVEWRKGRNKDA